MSIATHPMTYEDLCRMPDDGRRREIHDGELIVSPSPDWKHQKAIGRFAYEVRRYLARRRLPDDVFEAPLDVRLAPHNIYQPDLIYISPARRHIIRETMPIEGAPDLVVEVLSPSTKLYDQREKARVYARAGVLEYWILDPRQRAIEVFRLRDGVHVPIEPVEGRAVSVVLPGFSVDPVRLFADLD